MTAHTAYLHVANKTITVIQTGDAVPPGTINIGSFNHEHPGAASGDEPGISHVIQHHVRDLLYKRSAANPANVGFWPDNITDMTLYKIIVDDVVEAVSISMTPATSNLAVAATLQMVVAFTPANTTNQNVAYTTSNAGRATVSATGLVTGVSAGAVTITATSEDGAKVDTSTITVTA